VDWVYKRKINSTLSLGGPCLVSFVVRLTGNTRFTRSTRTALKSLSFLWEYWPGWTGLPRSNLPGSVVVAAIPGELHPYVLAKASACVGERSKGVPVFAALDRFGLAGDPTKRVWDVDDMFAA
jgi:hypothetical protein